MHCSSPSSPAAVVVEAPHGLPASVAVVRHFRYLPLERAAPLPRRVGPADVPPQPPDHDVEDRERGEHDTGRSGLQREGGQYDKAL